MVSSDASRRELDDARAALEAVERSAGLIVRSLDAGDLAAAETALDDRERALSALGAALDRVGGTWGVRPPNAADAVAAKEIADRVTRAAESGARVVNAVSRAQQRAHEGLRTVRCGSRLAEHQRSRGHSPKGGWCDVKR